MELKSFLDVYVEMSKTPKGFQTIAVVLSFGFTDILPHQLEFQPFLNAISLTARAREPFGIFMLSFLHIVAIKKIYKLSNALVAENEWSQKTKNY